MDEYKVQESLGKGGFGEVKKVVRKSDESVWAMKFIKVHDGNEIHICREASIMHDIQHPNIVRVERVILDRDSVCLLMHLYSMSLSEHIYRCSHKYPKAIKKFLGQLLSGVAHCHNLKIMHRDLKMSNLLVNIENDRHNIKITDFGLARGCIKQGVGISPQVGTLSYMAPEILLGDVHYDCAVDMWSIGCIFAEMVDNETLFEGNTEPSVLDNIFSKLGTPTEEIWPGVSSLPDWDEYTQVATHRTCEDFSYLSGKLDDCGVDLLKRFLSLDPSKRITASEALNHEFVQNWQHSDD